MAPRLARPLLLVLIAGSSLSAQPAPGGADAITVRLDCTDTARRTFHVDQTIPAKAGPLSLVYPKWIPGEHGPSGPIANVVGLTFTAGGKTIPWRRDLEDMYTFTLDVPAGAAAVEAHFDYVMPTDAKGWSAAASASPNLAIINWNTMVLAPKGRRAQDLMYQATLIMPRSWEIGGALPAYKRANGGVNFAAVSLSTLIDTPMHIGRYSRVIDLTPGQSPSHTMSVVADSPAALELSEARIGKYRQLIAEAKALFGTWHYANYCFLVTLSDQLKLNGLEHHESSDNRAPERWMIDDTQHQSYAALLSHEYFHSWNGKCARPNGLATSDFQEPMKGDLLWVYEGLTEYYGCVLAARAGLWSPEEYREYLAAVAASLDHTGGRAWRPLRDTCDAAQVLYSVGGQEWANERRGVDFYDEGNFIWLEADITIRSLTQGSRSLDDFCRAFHGGEKGRPFVRPYTEEEVYSTLNSVAPYDWKKFFEERISTVTPHVPLGGVTAGGWKLEYSEVDTPFVHAGYFEGLDTVLSLGLAMGKDGAIADVTRTGPAFGAGAAPGMKIVAVNSRKFTDDLLLEAITASKDAKDPIELLVENAGFFSTLKVDYHGGLRRPHLVRDASKPDALGAVIAPLSAAPAPKP